MSDWKLELPQLPKNLREDYPLRPAAIQAMEDDEYVSGRLFCQQSLEGIGDGVLDFKGCRFERCTFQAVDVNRMSFVDCAFVGCEMSNLPLRGAALKRVSFADCHLTGLTLEKAALSDASFTGCMMDYLSAGESKLDRVQFENCRLRESLWLNVKLGRTAFLDADLTQSEWNFTPLKGQDLSLCRIDGIRIALPDLYGLRLSSAQLAALSGLLGVTLTD